MSCNGTVFSFHELGANSVENEAFISAHCIPNLVKFGTFVAYLFLASLFTLVYGVLLGWNLYKEGLAWGLKKKIYLLLWIGSLSTFGKGLIFLFAVYSRWRYLLFPIPPICVVWTGIDLIQTWFQTVNSIHSMSQRNEAEVVKERKIYRGLIIWTIIGFLIFAGVAPIAAFDYPKILNGWYALAFSHYCTIAGVACAYMIIYGRRLLNELDNWKLSGKTVSRGGEERKIDLLASKIIFLTRTVTLFILPVFSTVLLPLIWVGVTLGEMEFSFYLQFFYSRGFSDCGAFRFGSLSIGNLFSQQVQLRKSP